MSRPSAMPSKKAMAYSLKLWPADVSRRGRVAAVIFGLRRGLFLFPLNLSLVYQCGNSDLPHSSKSIVHSSITRTSSLECQQMRNESGLRKPRVGREIGSEQRGSWRRRPELNRRKRFCRPLRNHSATSPDFGGGRSGRERVSISDGAGSRNALRRQSI